MSVLGSDPVSYLVACSTTLDPKPQTLNPKPYSSIVMSVCAGTAEGIPANVGAAVGWSELPARRELQANATLSISAACRARYFQTSNNCLTADDPTRGPPDTRTWITKPEPRTHTAQQLEPQPWSLKALMLPELPRNAVD
eukprot:2198221-Rhodomonas_salina.3